MVITTHELSPGDMPHLFCTDPELTAEVAAINRSLGRLDETVPTWIYLDPEETSAPSLTAASSRNPACSIPRMELRSDD